MAENDTHVAGVFMAITGSVVNSLGLLTQKWAHNKNANLPRNERSVKYVILGFAVYVCGNLCDLVALSLTAQTTVSGLSPLVLVANVLFAPCIVGEKVERKHVVATGIVMLGSILMTMFGPNSSVELQKEGCDTLVHLPGNCGFSKCAAACGVGMCRANASFIPEQTLDYLCLVDLMGETEFAAYLAVVIPILAGNFALCQWRQRTEWNTLWEWFDPDLNYYVWDDERGLAEAAELDNKPPLPGLPPPPGGGASVPDSHRVATSVAQMSSKVQPAPPHTADDTPDRRPAEGGGGGDGDGGGGGGGGDDGEARHSKRRSVFRMTRTKEKLQQQAEAEEKREQKEREEKQTSEAAALSAVQGRYVIDPKCFDLNTREGLWMGVSYGSYTALLGSFNIQFSKILGELVQTSFAGDNQFDKPVPWMFAAALLVCNSSSIMLLNSCLAKFDALFIIPLYQVSKQDFSCHAPPPSFCARLTTLPTNQTPTHHHSPSPPPPRFGHLFDTFGHLWTPTQGHVHLLLHRGRRDLLQRVRALLRHPGERPL
jgi:uncharacterized membrane protein